SPPYTCGMTRLFSIPTLCAVLALAACSGGVEWSARERDNALHVQASLRAVSEAAGIANGIDSAAEYSRRRDERLQHLRAAHRHAADVEDQVLDKLHPRFYGKFRLDYQRALARMIQAYERDDLDDAERAAADIRTFMDWYRRENHTFRWWKEAQG